MHTWPIISTRTRKCPLLSRIVDARPQIPDTLQFLAASALMITTALLSDGKHSLETMVVAPLPILFHAPIASVSRAMVAWCRGGAPRSRYVDFNELRG